MPPTTVPDLAREHTAQPISHIAASLGVHPDDLVPYGREMAKVSLRALERESPLGETRRKLVLVSAITPTPAGEGKTTTSIGLGQAFTALGHSVCLALREPSMGPSLGLKGGATGGGRAQLIPADRINLHFTGDFHAITSAHNLLASLIDNHLHFGNALGIDPGRVVWPRVLDLNDRALRHVVVGLGGVGQGVPRETSFDITAASEVMAILCLARDMADLRARLERILVAFTHAGEPVYARELGAAGAMLALLRDALDPNLVQAVGGTPVILHGGPFANIAHGCSSLVGTRLAMHLAEWTFTEAGFGFDLGAEKFLDIKCRTGGLAPRGVVLVTTIRALKMHGGQDLAKAAEVSPEAVLAGLPNLDKHIESARRFGLPVVVALNRFGADDDREIGVVRARCTELGATFAVSDHFEHGGEGALELARAVIDACGGSTRPEPVVLYDLDEPVPEKIRRVAQEMYGASAVVLTKAAERELRDIERLGHAGLPVCIAKTQNSLSDDPTRRGRPRDFTLTVRGLRVNSGAGFIVVLTGDIVRMPGLPRRPLAEQVDVQDGVIVGLR
ncbi:MAG: formate--tetrahydrofolate ligase [Sandaracinaceae bacterium]|nr:formate--tetrahydrofolate ligase [Sandaracinaceae bacterium]